MPTPVQFRGLPIIKRLPPGAKMVEVGVFVGTLSQFVLNQRRDISLVMVDNWAPAEMQPLSYVMTYDQHALQTPSQCEKARKNALGKVSIFKSRVEVMWLPSAMAAEKIENASVDLVFLDGDHSRKGVATDLAAWESKVKGSGYIGGHDYGNPSLAGDFSGVKVAVDLWAGGRNIEFDSDYTWFCRC
jgi:hypothetical protein